MWSKLNFLRIFIYSNTKNFFTETLKKFFIVGVINNELENFINETPWMKKDLLLYFYKLNTTKLTLNHIYTHQKRWLGYSKHFYQISNSSFKMCVCTCVCVCIHFHYGLSQDIEYSSPCYRVGPCCSSILCILVCIF